jgi:hypothetical protein
VSPRRPFQLSITMISIRRHLLALSTLAALMMPSTAAAYISPEEAFIDESFTSNLSMPHSRYDTANNASNQRLTSQQRREREQAEFFARQRGVTDPEHAAAPDATDEENQELIDALQELEDAIEAEDSEDEAATRREQRILERQQNAELHSGAPLAGSINSGAPLNESGPGIGIVIAVGCGAVLWVMKKAGKSSANAEL